MPIVPHEVFEVRAPEMEIEAGVPKYAAGVNKPFTVAAKRLVNPAGAVDQVLEVAFVAPKRTSEVPAAGAAVRVKMGVAVELALLKSERAPKPALLSPWNCTTWNDELATVTPPNPTVTVPVVPVPVAW